MSIWNKLFSTGATSLVDSVGSVLDNVITSDEERLAAEIKIKELVARFESDIERTVTDRWQSDMASDSWLSKHVRPMMLVLLVVMTLLLVVLDSFSVDFSVKQEWVSLLQIVLITVIGAYFGGRTMEKRKNN